MVFIPSVCCADDFTIETKDGLVFHWDNAVETFDQICKKDVCMYKSDLKSWENEDKSSKEEIKLSSEQAVEKGGQGLDGRAFEAASRGNKNIDKYGKPLNWESKNKWDIKEEK